MILTYGKKYIVKLECTVNNKVVEREVDVAWYMVDEQGHVDDYYIDGFETVNDWDEGTGEWHVVGVMEIPDIDSYLWVPYKFDVTNNEECTGDCDYCRYKYIVPGTDERIDREPRYYCGLFDDM